MLPRVNQNTEGSAIANQSTAGSML